MGADRAAAPLPPEPSEALLRERALRYLARYAASRGHLRTVLLRRALRDAAALGLEPPLVRERVEAVLARLTAAAILDDDAYARAKVRSLRERGSSTARIRMELRSRGLGREASDAALRALAEEVPDAERGAALTLARRRRLGPWRPAETRAAMRLKDLGVLARAGFTRAVAQEVVDAPSIEALGADPATP
jgi:regulatory protein